MSEATLGVIGGGVMGEALLSRLIDQGVFGKDRILVSDPSASRRQFLYETYGIQVVEDNEVVVQQSHVVLLAVKPQILPKVVEQLKDTISTVRPLLLSILAGATLHQLTESFVGWSVIRAMPNTPATIGAGITALSPAEGVTPQQIEQAKQIFASVGDVVEVPEHLMDAVTSLSGSGPGYIAVVVESLADGGVAAGLPRATALKLAIQTVKGTAELLQQSGMHPGALKDRVTSPGGTTIAGVAALEAHGLRSALIRAVQAACARSKELGQG